MKNKKRDSYKSYRFKLILNRLIPHFNRKSKNEEFKAKYSRVSEAPMHLAIVLDGIVEDIIHCDDRLGILLLSEPKIVEIPADKTVDIDYLYDEDKNKFFKDGVVNG
jgi:hypothetical protein